MGVKYDQEDLLDSLKAMLVDGDALNLRIAAIEAEKVAKGKGLTPTLAPISVTRGYFQQTWDAAILNESPAIFFGIEDVQAADGSGAVAKTYKIFFEVVMVDSGMQNDGHRRIARYSRALEEIFTEQFAAAGVLSKIKVDAVRPISFKLELDSSEEIKVGGVSLQISLY